jgi:S-adenosylmethionine decarboxylase
VLNTLFSGGKLKEAGSGIHILLNLFDCNTELLENTASVSLILNKAVEGSGMTKVGESFHQFEPQGATGVLLLSESHICIHTWPEHNSAAVDIFCCGSEEQAHIASDILVKMFESAKFDKQVCYRKYV